MQAIPTRDVNAILLDYAPDAVLFTPIGVFRGREQLRAAWSQLLQTVLSPETLSQFTLLRQDVEREVAYLTWSAGDAIPFGTDSFVIRDGKIVAQTASFYSPKAR